MVTRFIAAHGAKIELLQTPRMATDAAVANGPMVELDDG
jgi:hypothetical protein